MLLDALTSSTLTRIGRTGHHGVLPEAVPTPAGQFNTTVSHTFYRFLRSRRRQAELQVVACR